MKFVYDRPTDAYCWDQINAQVSIFGEEKKTGEYPVSRRTMRRFMTVWKPNIEKKFRIGMVRIFGKEFDKKNICYINSTLYSMEVPGGISISAGTKMPIRSICHEANHVMFRNSDYKKRYFPRRNVEDAKEIFTVLNNIYFQSIIEQQDIGWRKFWKERYQFLLLWLATHPDVLRHEKIKVFGGRRRSTP